MEKKTSAVAVLLFTPDGIPLVRDKKKPFPHYWKLPGGRGPSNWNPKSIAIQKLVKEIGVSLLIEELVLVHTENRGDHDFSLFVARLEKSRKLRKRGLDGEEVRLFKILDILSLGDIFPNHRQCIEKYTCS